MQIGRDHITAENALPGNSIQAAVERAYAILGPDLCPICPRQKELPVAQPLNYMI